MTVRPPMRALVITALLVAAGCHGRELHEVRVGALRLAVPAGWSAHDLTSRVEGDQVMVDQIAVTPPGARFLCTFTRAASRDPALARHFVDNIAGAVGWHRQAPPPAEPVHAVVSGIEMAGQRLVSSEMTFTGKQPRATLALAGVSGGAVYGVEIDGFPDEVTDDEPADCLTALRPQ